MKDELENCRLTNCTPHDVVIVGSNGVNSVTIPASGVLPRCAVTTEKVGEVKVDGVTIPLTSSHFGEVTGLPEASDGTLLIVSRVVADASPGRHDLVVPADLVRDLSGQVIGARSLSFVH